MNINELLASVPGFFKSQDENLREALSGMFAPPPGILGDQEEAVKKQMQMQGLLGIASGLFQAGTPSRTRQSLFQGIPLGQQMAQGTLDQALKAIQLRQQTEDAQNKRAQQQAQQKALTEYVSTLPESERLKFLAFPSQAAEAMFRKKETSPGVIGEFEAAKAQGIIPADATLTDYVAMKQPPERNAPGVVGEFEAAKARGIITPETTLAQYIELKKPPGTTVNVGVQKDFKNELDLKTEFRNEPVYKAHQEMTSAYNQISSSIKQASPAGDLAAATKFMKLLDPGSVVRESELMMAMQASGAYDRFVNYANNIISGNKLTPVQRQDFQSLADKLFAASVGSYNIKLNEYKDIGKAYGINADRALGKPAKMPEQAKPVGSGLADQVKREMERRGLK